MTGSKLKLSSPSNYRHTEKLVRKASGADVREKQGCHEQATGGQVGALGLTVSGYSLYAVLLYSAHTHFVL